MNGRSGLRLKFLILFALPAFAVIWAVGFLIGIIPFLPVPEIVKTYSQPATLYSSIAGFLVYVALAKVGLQPHSVEE